MGRKRRTFMPHWKKIGGLQYGLAMEPNVFASKQVALDTAERIRRMMHWSVRVVSSRGRYAVYQRKPGG